MAQVLSVANEWSRERLSKYQGNTDFMLLLRQVFVIALNEKLQNSLETEKGRKIITENEEIRIQDILELIVSEEAQKGTVSKDDVGKRRSELPKWRVSIFTTFS